MFTHGAHRVDGFCLLVNAEYLSGKSKTLHLIHYCSSFFPNALNSCELCKYFSWMAGKRKDTFFWLKTMNMHCT